MNKGNFQGKYFAFELENNFLDPFDGTLVIFQAKEDKLLQKSYPEVASDWGVEAVNDLALAYLSVLELTEVYSFHDGTGIKTLESLFPRFNLIRAECGGDRIIQYRGLTNNWKEFFKGEGIKLIFIDDLINYSKKKRLYSPYDSKR